MHDTVLQLPPRMSLCRSGMGVRSSRGVAAASCRAGSCLMNKRLVLWLDVVPVDCCLAVSIGAVGVAALECGLQPQAFT